MIKIKTYPVMEDRSSVSAEQLDPERRQSMLQVINNVAFITLDKDENPNNAMPMLLRRFESVIEQNVQLTIELEKARERERKMSLTFPG